MRELSFFSRKPTTLEVTFLAVVLACLPLFEAPKNVFSVFFLFAWVVYAFLSRRLGRNSPFDMPILGLAAILWISPIFSEFGDTITALNSAPRWTLLAVFVLAASRLDYSRRQFVILLAAFMVGAVAAIIESFAVWSVNGKQYPEFRSVGHVNHSSMYTLILLAAGIGAVQMRERWLKVLGFVAVISSVAFVPFSLSLVGGVAVSSLLTFGVVSWAVRRQSLRTIVFSICALVTVFAGTLATPVFDGFRSEMVSRIQGDDIFSSRDKIFNSALLVWDRHPLLGTGWFSFGTATSEEAVVRSLAEGGREYDPNLYAHHNHGHNLWTTMLVERGLLGVGLVSLLLVRYCLIFLPFIFSHKKIDLSDIGAAVTASLISISFVVAGLGNTTMINEHGQAGMTLIAICYGYLRGRALLGKDKRSG